MSKRSYSDEEKANALLALQANGGRIKQTAEATGIPWSTLKQWSIGNHVTNGVTDICEEKRAPLAERTEALAHQLLDALVGQLQEAASVPVRDLAVSYAIAVDKMRLLREQPTTISREELTDAERADGVASLLQRVRERGAGPPPPPGPSVN